MFDGVLDFSKGINLVYGGPATGKTTIAMQLSNETAMDKRIVFIDTENGFSLERFKQIAGDECMKRLEKIFLLRINDFFEQHKAIENLSRIKNLGLIVVDTLGMHYRTNVREDSGAANRMLDKQFKALQELTRKHIPVLITTQVYADMENNGVKVLGGEMVKNWAGVIVRLEREPRKLVIEKPFRKERRFEINDKGIILM